MGFVDLFRPKWKHSDAEVRAAAVRELDADAGEILAGIARSDSDAAVRRIALKKLENTEVLAEIAKSDPDESLRQFAGEKVASILVLSAVSATDGEAGASALAQLSDDRAIAEVAKSAGLEPLRQAAVARLRDAKALAEVARNATDSAVRMEALRRLTDPASLRSIALSEGNKEVALAAVDRLSDRESLDAVAKRAKVKAVRVRAQKLLASLKGGGGEGKPAATTGGASPRHARQLQMVRTVETLARSSDWDRTVPKIEEAQASWKELGTDAEAELRERFSAACEGFFTRLGTFKAQRAEQAARVQEARDALAARTALCEQIEALSVPEVAERLPVLEASWAELPQVPRAEQEGLETRFRRACEGARRRQENQGELEARRGKLEKLCADAEEAVGFASIGQARRRMRELEAEWRQAGGVADEAMQARFKQAASQLEQRATDADAQRERRRKENQERLEELCKRLEGLAATPSLKTAERVLKETASVFSKLGPLAEKSVEDELKRRYHAAREAVNTRVRELRETEEWKRWSNVSKQEELCVRVEALREAKELKEVAQKLREAQAEWKKLGPAPKDKAEQLWGRFKEACDAAYARCQEYFAQLDGERSENLKKKEALCEQVETLSTSSEWNAAADRIKELQGEWKKIGPVPRAQSDEIWKRFRAACDRFFARRQEHLDQVSGERGENLQKKEALCAKAEEIAGVEASDWGATANELKRLQAEWKKIGPVPRSKSDAIWQRFRAACDRFFDRRQDEQDKGRVENLHKREELCASLEAIAAAAEPADAAEVVKQVEAMLSAWREVGPAPREQSDAVQDRFNQARGKVVERYAEAFRGTELDPLSNLKKKEKLCSQVEAFMPREAPAEPGPETSTAAGSVEEMAERLRKALAANTFAGGAPVQADPRAILDEVREIQQEWRSVGPGPVDRDELLNARFRLACDRVFEHYRSQAPARREGERGERRPRGPREERGARDRGARPERGERERGERGERAEGRRREPAAQVSELQREENLKRKQEICARAEALAAAPEAERQRSAVKELQRQWKAVGPVPDAEAKSLWNRFRKACNAVLQSAPASASVASEALAAPAESAAPGAIAPSVSSPAILVDEDGWDPEPDPSTPA